MPADLAPVYLDDTRVTLQGDPRPKVAKILQAGGRPTDARVVWLKGRSGQDRSLGPDEVIDRTGDPGQPVHLRTATPADAHGQAHARPGHVQKPGDILRGTDTPATSSEQEARAGRNPSKAQRFAENQSFGDPVHKGGSPRVAPDTEPSTPSGGLRMQEGGSQEGGRPPRKPATTTTSRESLHRVSEEE